jgi:7-cyano-7-deazaguanine reductase
MAKSKNTPAPAGLTLLGKSGADFPAVVSPEILETFENRYPQRDYVIRFESDDFTSLCPVTGQPDFAALHIEYVPNKRCIETKSLKFYLSSYRNCAAFNEEVANRILEDLVDACGPRRMRVFGEFAARGGISVSVEAEHVARKVASRK